MMRIIDFLLRGVLYATTLAIAVLFLWVFMSVLDGIARANGDAGALLILGFVLAILITGLVCWDR